MRISLNKITNTMLLVLIGIMPLGLFTVKGWASGILFVCAALSLIKLIAESIQPGQKQPENQEKFWPALILLALMLPLTSAIISSGLRGELIWADFDAQSRFFLGVLVFYAIFRSGLDPFRYLQYSIPIGLILTIVVTSFLPEYRGANIHFGSRLATYFVDPLTLGYLSLTLGILSFFSIHLFSKDHWYAVALKLLGTVSGFYISLQTQSRTGWLAIPFIIFLMLWLYGPKNKIKSSAIALVTSLVFTIGIYQVSPTVQNRVGAAVADLRDYQFDKVNAESSLGERISFARMAFYYFKLNPISGWGYKGYQAHMNDPELVAFATFNTRNAPGSGALFHSEIATNSVAFGVLGLIYTVLLFFAPLVLFIKSWRLGINSRLCAFGVAYILCILVSSFTTEIFALKFAASFHALFIASICAQVLNCRRRDS